MCTEAIRQRRVPFNTVQSYSMAAAPSLLEENSILVRRRRFANIAKL